MACHCHAHAQHTCLHLCKHAKRLLAACGARQLRATEACAVICLSPRRLPPVVLAQGPTWGGQAHNFVNMVINGAAQEEASWRCHHGTAIMALPS